MIWCCMMWYYMIMIWYDTTWYMTIGCDMTTVYMTVSCALSVHPVFGIPQVVAKGRVHVTHHSRHEGMQWPRICPARRFHHLEEIKHGEGLSVWTSPDIQKVSKQCCLCTTSLRALQQGMRKLRKVRVTTSPSSTSSKRMRWSPTWNSSVPRPNLCAFCSGIQHLTTSFSSATAEITPTSHCKTQPHCYTQLCKTSSFWGFIISVFKSLSVCVFCTKSRTNFVFLTFFFSLFPKLATWQIWPWVSECLASVWNFSASVKGGW